MTGMGIKNEKKMLKKSIFNKIFFLINLKILMIKCKMLTCFQSVFLFSVNEQLI